MKGHGAKFGRKKEEAIAALLTHRSVDEAARSIGLNANALLRWLEIPEFRDGYRKARRESVQQAVARLQQVRFSSIAAVLIAPALISAQALDDVERIKACSRRNGSARIAGSAQANYCQVKENMFAYLLRVEPEEGSALVSSALQKRSKDTCYTDMLESIARVDYTPALGQLAQRAIRDDPESSVAASAAQVLSEYGPPSAEQALWDRFASSGRLPSLRRPERTNQPPELVRRVGKSLGILKMRGHA